MEFINSLDNSTIKKVKKLKQRKYREEEKKFLAEGRKFLGFYLYTRFNYLKRKFWGFWKHNYQIREI